MKVQYVHIQKHFNLILELSIAAGIVQKTKKLYDSKTITCIICIYCMYEYVPESNRHNKKVNLH